MHTFKKCIKTFFISVPCKISQVIICSLGGIKVPSDYFQGIWYHPLLQKFKAAIFNFLNAYEIGYRWGFCKLDAA